MFRGDERWLVLEMGASVPDEIGRLLDLGVDGIMTDRPTVLKQVFTDRGRWVDPV